MLKKTFKLLLLTILVVLVFAVLKFTLLGKELKTDSIAAYLTRSENKKNIELTFLGCAGFIIEYQQKSILCDPYFSNPGLLDFGKKQVSWTNYVSEKKLASVDLVTISHGHYDHCYDIEGLGQFMNPESKIVADASVHNQLNAIYKNKSFQKNALNYEEKQDWIYNKDSLFRVFPLQSTHNPHIGKIEFLKGKYNEPLDEIPTKQWQWKKGEAYSYLIDILQHDSVIYRMVLVNGTLTSKAIAALKEQSEKRNSDVQLQIFWKEKLVTENMNIVYNITKPEQLILHHWNNFFIPINKPIQYFRDSHLPEVLKSYNEKKIPMSVMLPFTTVNL
jgi:ribonuclease BN (tRNA processing enzyme)